MDKMTESPKPHPNALNGMAIGMRNRGQFYVCQLGGSPVYIGDWLKREFDRYGYDLKDMARL